MLRLSGMTLLRRRALAAAVVCVLFAASAPAAELAVSTFPEDGDGAAPLRLTDGVIELTLDEAVAIALERNLDLRIERFNRRQFHLGIQGAMGIFDLRLDAFARAQDQSSPTVSQLQAGAGVDVLQSEAQNFNLGLAQLTPIGADVQVGLNNTRSETNSTFVDVNPAFDVNTQVTVGFPLLRDFGTLATRRDVLSAQLVSRGSRQFFETQVASIIQQVENGYWDLVEAIEQLGVAEEGVRLAEELHRRNKVQVDVGTLPPLELVQSEANIATRQEEIIRARTAVGDAGDRLRLLLNVDQGPAWDAAIEPLTDPRTETIEIDLAEAIATAVARRAELAQQRLEVERLDLDARFFRNQALPRLDLVASYGYSGVGGDATVPVLDDEGNPVRDPETGDIITTVVPGGYSDAFDQMTEGGFDNWEVTLTFAYPLQNRAAKAQMISARLEKEEAESRQRQFQQQVITEVRTAVRGVSSAAQQIASAEVSRRLQERNLEAEQKRYENGMSTSFQVTQIQEDLTLAKSREVTAIASYRRALTEYYRAVGRLLEVTGVELVDPAS